MLVPHHRRAEHLPEEQRLRQEPARKARASSRSNEVRWFKINRISSWYESISQLERLNANPAGYFSDRRYVVEEYQASW